MKRKKLPKSLTPNKKPFSEKDLEEFKELGWSPSLKSLNNKPSQKWSKKKKKRK
jgi:hypothetical protein|tara:strand:+ start:50 stop:211 length:162 start_codon:yes stop_codon:yes gene_type:complete